MNDKIKQILQICRELIQIPSLIEYEQEFLKYLNERLNNKNFNIIRGNQFLYITPSNQETQYIFSAHIDRHGLIKNEDDEIEFLAFYLKRKYNLDFPRDELNEDEEHIKNQISKYFQTSLSDNFFSIQDSNIKTKFIRKGSPIDFEKTGLRHLNETVTSYKKFSSNKEKEYKVIHSINNFKENKISFLLDKTPSNSEVLFSLDNNIYEHHNLIWGQIDNIISASILVYLIENNILNQSVIFTTREEIGLSWKSFLELETYNISLDNKKLIILDTSPYQNVLYLDEGSLTLREGDERANFDTETSKLVNELLTEMKIPFNTKPSNEGKTELGKIIKETKTSLNGTTLQLPTMNYHTSVETTTKKSLRNYIEVIEKINFSN